MTSNDYCKKSILGKTRVVTLKIKLHHDVVNLSGQYSVHKYVCVSIKRMLLILLLNVQIYKLNGQLYYQCTLLKQDVYDRPGFVLT